MSVNPKILLIAMTALLGAVIAAYVLVDAPAPTAEVVPEPAAEESTVIPFVATSTIGTSVEGRTIEVATYGAGSTTLLFVGGIHGGYEWNSSLLAYEMMDYLGANPTVVPDDITISIIPVLNPDGLHKVIGIEGVFTLADVSDPTTRVAEGRFNASGIDLNRNFGCKWAPTSTWRGNVVSAGTEAFSEPEAAALRDYVVATNPSAVAFWHSQANNVYASECEDGVLPATLAVMNAYAEAGGYGAVPVFDAYPITGDAEGWLASIGIPAVTVELESASSIEWERNLAGVQAVIDLYSE